MYREERAGRSYKKQKIRHNFHEMRFMIWNNIDEVNVSVYDTRTETLLWAMNVTRENAEKMAERFNDFGRFDPDPSLAIVRKMTKEEAKRLRELTPGMSLEDYKKYREGYTIEEIAALAYELTDKETFAIYPKIPWVISPSQKYQIPVMIFLYLFFMMTTKFSHFIAIPAVIIWFMYKRSYALKEWLAMLQGGSWNECVSLSDLEGNWCVDRESGALMNRIQEWVSMRRREIRPEHWRRDRRLKGKDKRCFHWDTVLNFWLTEEEFDVINDKRKWPQGVYNDRQMVMYYYRKYEKLW